MITVSVEAQVSVEELLKAVEQLSSRDLDAFVDRVLTLRARRHCPSLPQAEADLLLEINQGLPPDVRRRYDGLVAKRRAETLTAEEYDELLQLSDQIELMDARRIERLATLARLREVPLEALMAQLGIRPPEHA